jgi:hypothetical protein
MDWSGGSKDERTLKVRRLASAPHCISLIFDMIQS